MSVLNCDFNSIWGFLKLGLLFVLFLTHVSTLFSSTHFSQMDKTDKKDSYKNWLANIKKPSTKKTGVSREEDFRRVQEERKKREAELKHRQSSGE